MTLKELYDEQFSNVGFIGVCETDENDNVKPIYPEYADEFLETNGDMEVKGYCYSKKHDCLVVTSDESINLKQ